MSNFYKDITKMTEESIQSQYKAISDCLAKDILLASKGEDVRYGVRDYPDWEEQKDEIEAELNRRGIPYTPINI